MIGATKLLDIKKYTYLYSSSKIGSQSILYDLDAKGLYSITFPALQCDKYVIPMRQVINFDFILNVYTSIGCRISPY